MNRENRIQTLVECQPTWKVAGEWVVANEPFGPVTNIDIPAFVIWAKKAMESMSKTGLGDELPSTLVSWMQSQMEAKDSFPENSDVHSVFSKVFPISSLPGTVAPEWHQWKIIETAEPKRVVVVQPLILSPMAVPRIMVMEQVRAQVYSPSRVDPFVMAQVNRNDINPVLSREESGHLRALIVSFWNNLVSAGKLAEFSQKVALLTPHKAAEAFPKVEQEASKHISELVERISLYLRSQDKFEANFPLSMVSRGAIQLPWIIKTAEAWMDPIRTLAEAGHIELPVA